MMRPTWTGSGVVVALALASWSLQRTGQTRDGEAASAAAVRAELRALRDSIADAQGEIRALRARQRMQEERPALAVAEPVPAHEPQEGPVPSDVPAEAQAEPSPEPSLAEQTRRFVDHADAVLAQQTRDPSWREAGDLPARVKGILPAGSEVHSVGCGSTLCRVETKHRDPDAYRAFVGGIAALPRADGEVQPPFWAGPVAFLRLGDPESAEGEVHAVAYLARENTDLPEP